METTKVSEAKQGHDCQQLVYIRSKRDIYPRTKVRPKEAPSVGTTPTKRGVRGHDSASSRNAPHKAPDRSNRGHCGSGSAERCWGRGPRASGFGQVLTISTNKTRASDSQAAHASAIPRFCWCLVGLLGNLRIIQKVRDSLIERPRMYQHAIRTFSSGGLQDEGDHSLQR